MSARLWFALAGGPVLWLVHLSGASALVPYACAQDARWTVDALTVATALPTGAALAVAVRMHRSEPDAVGAMTGRARLLTLLAVLVSGVSLLLIVLEGLPNLVLEPCP